MDDSELPAEHPRYESLLTRHRIEAGVERGITSKQGLIAQGRGEAFDYLLGEETIESAARAERAGVARLLLADRPVISVNGNVAALAPEASIELARAVGGDLEINLFNRTDARMEAIAAHLREHGAETVKGLAADGHLDGIDHARATVDADGIASADAVLVPLEDGDRAEALAAAGIDVIAIDLNPGSRTSHTADVPIVDNAIRALPAMVEYARELADADEAALAELMEGFDAEAVRRDAERAIREGEFETP